MRTATRPAMERLAALDRAIRAGAYPNAASFARAMEVEPRTVQRDIEFLRDRLGAPLAYDARRRGFAYSDPEYRLSFLDLGEDELILLFLARGVLSQYHGTPYAADLASACRKIAAGLAGSATEGLTDSHSFRLSSSLTQEPGLFHALDTAIRDRSHLAIRYYSASRDEETAREVDPYHLASIDGQFYLIAMCHLRGSVKMFVPGRVRSWEATGATFAPAEGLPHRRLPGRLVRRGARGGEGEDGTAPGSGSRARRPATSASAPGTLARQPRPPPRAHLVVGLTLGHLREVERLDLLLDAPLPGPRPARASRPRGPESWRRPPRDTCLSRMFLIDIRTPSTKPQCGRRRQSPAR